MPRKNRSDSKDFTQKHTLNPSDGGKATTSGPSGAPPDRNPSGLTNQRDPDRKIGQFTGRGSPGLQKK